MLALLGSKALAFYGDIGRIPMDTDFLGTYEDCTAYIKELGKRERIICNMPVESGKKILVKTMPQAQCLSRMKLNIYEFEIAWELSNSAKLADIIFASCELVKDEYGNEFALPHLDVLYMLKMSHRFKKNSPHFLKTLNDIKLMESFGAKFPVQYQAWFDEREKITYTNSLPKLNQSKKDFFDNSNNIYTWDHDDLHRIVKHLDVPAYELYKPDSKEVFTSKEMFFEVDEQVRLYGALEEIYVLSLERAIWPFPDVNRRWAFNTAHEKLATSVSSGWFRKYVYDNYEKIQSMYSEEYVHKFYAEVNAGTVKKFDGG